MPALEYSSAGSKEYRAVGPQASRDLRYVAAGKLQRLRRGLYCLPNYRQEQEHGDLAIVGKQNTEADVICLLSAMPAIELTTQVPSRKSITVDHKARAPASMCSLKVMRFGQTALGSGAEARVIEGVPVHITTIEKTIADCLRYRNKVGLMLRSRH